MKHLNKSQKFLLTCAVFSALALGGIDSTFAYDRFYLYHPDTGAEYPRPGGGKTTGTLLGFNVDQFTISSDFSDSKWPKYVVSLKNSTETVTDTINKVISSGTTEMKVNTIETESDIVSHGSQTIDKNLTVNGNTTVKGTETVDGDSIVKGSQTVTGKET